VKYNHLEIILNNIIPIPLLQADVSESQIWRKENIKFRAEESYMIIAESGKGKTSLLSILFGHRKDYQGEAYYNSKNIKTISDKNFQLIRKNDISMVFQGLQLFDELTAFENIMLKNNLNNSKTESEIFSLAKELNVYDFLNQKTITLSFGQKQRIAIIRALCSPYKFIFLDEAFSHLDYENAKTSWKIIKEDAKAKKAGIIINSLKQVDFINPSITYKL